MKLRQQLAVGTIGGLLAVAAAGSQAQDRISHFKTSNGTQVTVASGPPKQDEYGPAPSFAQLDANHDGLVSRHEAAAFAPLLNDFAYVSKGAKQISKAHFDHWVRTQYRPGISKT